MNMKKTVFATIIASIVSFSAFAQQVPSPSPSYAPIILDEAKFNNFYNALTEISMTQKTWQQIFALLQALERDALQERARNQLAPEEKKND